MRKADLNNLCAGNKVISKKDSTILEVVGMDKEQGKAIMDNGKMYSFSTIYRWFDLAPVEEVKQPVQPKEAVEDKPVQPIKPVVDDVELHLPIKPTNTSEKVVANENHEDHTVEANSKVVEGENTIEQIIQEYKCHTQKMQQYTAVKSDNTKKTLVYIRVAKEGGYHFDISQKTWHKLNKAYANWLTTNFNAGIKDKTRKLYRVSCNDLKIFRNLLLVALS